MYCPAIRSQVILDKREPLDDYTGAQTLAQAEGPITLRRVIVTSQSLAGIAPIEYLAIFPKDADQESWTSLFIELKLKLLMM